MYPFSKLLEDCECICKMFYRDFVILTNTGILPSDFYIRENFLNLNKCVFGSCFPFEFENNYIVEIYTLKLIILIKDI
jgi:hypothetical protein